MSKLDLEASPPDLPKVGGRDVEYLAVAEAAWDCSPATNADVLRFLRVHPQLDELLAELGFRRLP